MLTIKELRESKKAKTQIPIPGEQAFVSGLNMPKPAIILKPEMGASLRDIITFLCDREFICSIRDNLNVLNKICISM